jgi:hypothetical protein
MLFRQAVRVISSPDHHRMLSFRSIRVYIVCNALSATRFLINVAHDRCNVRHLLVLHVYSTTGNQEERGMRRLPLHDGLIHDGDRNILHAGYIRVASSLR